MEWLVTFEDIVVHAESEDESETATIPGTTEITFDFTQKGTPGFELLTLLGALSICFILIKRRK